MDVDVFRQEVDAAVTQQSVATADMGTEGFIVGSAVIGGPGTT